MRSGSSVINESLEMHPDLKVAYEIFNCHATAELTNIPDIRQTLKKLYGFESWNKVNSTFGYFPTSGRYDIGTYKTISEDVSLNKMIDFAFERYDGFKILYNQLKINYKVWDYLVSCPNLKVIHTYRRNHLDSLVSLYVAHGSSEWQVRKGGSDIDDESFSIPVGVAEEYFLNSDFEIEHFTSMFKNSIEIEYEELYDWENTISRVVDFLGIKSIFLTPKYKKRNKKSPKLLIENYLELKNYFRNTKWFKLFLDSEIKVFM